MKNKKTVMIGGAVASVLLIIIAVIVMNGSKQSEIVRPGSKNSAALNASAESAEPDSISETGGLYDYKDAPKHIGEEATVQGKILKAFTAKSGVTFLDFCPKIDSCQFSAVIFASDLPKFGDMKKYERAVKIHGLIKSYSGKAEIVVNDPGQIE
jgi:hypothetical protein